MKQRGTPYEVDTTLIDRMFPEGIYEKDLQLCNKIMFTLKAQGTDYEVTAWKELADIVMSEHGMMEWGNHFMKIANGIERRNIKKRG